MNKFFEATDLQNDVVVSILETQTGTGYVLKGEKSSLFLWRNDQRLKFLLIAIASWLESGQGYQIEYYKDETAPKGVALRKRVVKGKHVALRWFLTDRGYSTVEVKEEENPFL